MKEIPVISLQRLPIYLNYLRSIPEGYSTYISSRSIAEALGMGEVLVRKDLAFTSNIGKPKVGYIRKELIKALEEYLGCNNNNHAVIVGTGGLGKALLSYGGFHNFGIEVVAGFDCDPQKIGQQVAGKPIYAMEELAVRVPALDAKLAIIAVPVGAAQTVCDQLVEAGVKAILNFSPILLKVADGVDVRNIDVAANLAVLVSRMK